MAWCFTIGVRYKILRAYQQALNARYKVELRLHLYAVVALEFERLVFVEIGE